MARNFLKERSSFLNMQGSYRPTLLVKKTISHLQLYIFSKCPLVNVLAIRQVKQGTETTGFRIGFTLHSFEYVSS